MQKLYFEAAWDKTIAPRDRERIEIIFQEQAMHLKDNRHISFLWQAKNHQGELLVTVLIHNGDKTDFCLQDTVITYYEQTKQIATGLFTLPSKIAGKTSMPWTLIFSQSNQTPKSAQYMVQNCG